MSLGSFSSSFPPKKGFELETYYQDFQKERTEVALKKLLPQAQDFFKSSQEKFKIVSCPLVLDTPLSLFKQIFSKGFKGVCLAEKRHEHISPKRLLINLMPSLKELGVETIFLEHLKNDLLQEKLDAWFKQEEDAPLPEEVSEALAAIDFKYELTDSPYSYTNLVLAAKRSKIRIVALDSSIATKAGSFNRHVPMNLDRRVMVMNYTSVEILEREKGKAKEDRFVTLFGEKHGFYKKITGIPQIIQCPLIVVADSEGLQQPNTYLQSDDPNKNPEQLAYSNGAIHALIVSPKRRSTE